ncbi:MAG: 50S ribosomal protein L7Ae [Candidatus Diapherotrites archaeon]|nr:50S ribosomal protein L7Ae [Candidatus Diapherotrites archaeon]
MAGHVKLELSGELKEKQLVILERVKKSGKIKVGVNEVTKSVERGLAKLVVIAEDVNPPELVMHLPLLCEEKNIPYSYVSTRKELGEKSGLKVAAASIAILDEGDAKKELLDFVIKLKDLKK